MSTGCGYSILNHVMIGVGYCMSKYTDIKKIAIVDLDIHHGNGTEEIVKRLNKTDELLYISIHLYCKDPVDNYEFYPGTGDADDYINNIYNCPIKPLWDKSYYIII